MDIKTCCGKIIKEQQKEGKWQEGVQWNTTDDRRRSRTVAVYCIRSRTARKNIGEETTEKMLKICAKHCLKLLIC